MINKLQKIIFFLIFLMFFLINLIISADFNYDDFDELISYAVNANISNRPNAKWAKNILSKDPGAISNLLNHLNTVNARTIYELRLILKDAGSPAVQPLIDYISDTITYGNLTAVYVLGEIGDTRALDKLIELLNSEHSSVKSVTAAAVGKMKDEKVIYKLLELSTDPNEMVRKSSIVALGKIAFKNKNVINSLLENNTEDTFYFVRFSAIEAVQKFDTKTVANLLFQEIKNTKPTKELHVLLRILSAFNIKDENKLKTIINIFDETSDELLAEYALKIILTSIKENEEYLKKFKNKFNRDPFLK